MQANPDRGEVALVVNGTEYTLRPRTNAIRDLQRRTGKTYLDILKGLDEFDAEYVTQFLFAVLQPYHAKQFKHVDQVGDLIDDAGGIVVIVKKLLEMLRANTPKPSTAEEDARPLVARSDDPAPTETSVNSGSTLAPVA